MLNSYIKKIKVKRLKAIDSSKTYYLYQKFMKNLFKVP